MSQLAFAPVLMGFEVLVCFLLLHRVPLRVLLSSRPASALFSACSRNLVGMSRLFPLIFGNHHFLFTFQRDFVCFLAVALVFAP